MKAMRRFVAMFVSVCLSFYAIPAFAYTHASEHDSVKIELTEAEMDVLVGANGSVDATMADYTKAGSQATAVFANRTTTSVSYALEAIDINGGVVEVLAQGSLNPQMAILVSGTPADNTTRNIRARVYHAGLPGLESKDTSWAP